MLKSHQCKNSKYDYFFYFAFLCLIAYAWAAPALALNTSSNTVNADSLEFGGPSSVGETISKDIETETRGKRSTQDDSERYFAFKKRLEKDYGFAFGFDYNALLQYATQSLGEDTAAGGAFRAFGEWVLVGQNLEDKNKGSLVYKVENRHRLGTKVAPMALAPEIGYTGLTSITFSNIQWALTNLYWSQKFLDDRLSLIAGDVDATDYLDVYGLVNVWTAFNNCAFTTSPTIPVPDQGLGAALRFMPTNNIYILGGIEDANGNPTRPEKFFDSFVNDAEFFTHLEIGWISSLEKQFDDNIHLMVWHADERKKADVRAGWGMAFSCSHLFAQRWEPFVRGGYAKDGGALWEKSVSVGVGYYTKRRDDVIALGLNWDRPSEAKFGDALRDQYSTEAFYRLQISRFLTISPGVQVLFDPALNPGKSMITVFEVRGRVSI